jgi:hypothetical protein
MGDWLDVSPRARTQAIYDEIRRLDQAWVNGTAAPEQGETGNLAYQMAITPDGVGRSLVAGAIGGEMA